MTTPLPLPMQCEHPHLIALNPFIGNDIVAVVVTQCERTLRSFLLHWGGASQISDLK